MNIRNFNFSYLVTRAIAHFGESYTGLKEKYKDYPMCLVEDIDHGVTQESIEIDFEQKNACVTYYFDANRILNSSSIRFYKPSDVDLFRSYIEKHAESYCDETKRWYISENCYITVEENKYGIYFRCFYGNHKIMNTKTIDFGYLILLGFIHLWESHKEIKESFKNFPLIEYPNKNLQCIKINFDKEGAYIIYYLNNENLPTFASIGFNDPSSENLFISYIQNITEQYDNQIKRWTIGRRFQITMEESRSTVNFCCNIL